MSKSVEPTTGLVLDPCFTRHDPGRGHAERAARNETLIQALTAAGLVGHCRVIAPSPAEPRSILANHDAQYVERLRQACAAGATRIDCDDSAICRETFEVAELAAGAVLAAADQVASGRLQNAFCAVRPPGHHAERDRSMGFCMFNNVAVAARHLLTQCALQRVAIVDWDVHHGNGTQHSFEEDPRVLFISIHGHPDTLYPGSGYAEEQGRGAGLGFTLNVPMWPGSGDAEYRQAFDRAILPALARYRPEFLLISAGFDAHRADPLAAIELETTSFKWMTEELCKQAASHCQGRILSVLEGGYDLQALADCVITHVETLLGAQETNTASGAATGSPQPV